jgi:hypothetical protein
MRTVIRWHRVGTGVEPLKLNRRGASQAFAYSHWRSGGRCMELSKPWTYLAAIPEYRRPFLVVQITQPTPVSTNRSISRRKGNSHLRGTRRIRSSSLRSRSPQTRREGERTARRDEIRDGQRRKMEAVSRIVYKTRFDCQRNPAAPALSTSQHDLLHRRRRLRLVSPPLLSCFGTRRSSSRMHVRLSPEMDNNGAPTPLHHVDTGHQL